MASVKTRITELPDSRVRLDAEVPADEVERRVQEVARRLGRQLRIPGFRKGKVPPPVVLRRLGREAVLGEAVEGALGTWAYDAIEGAGIHHVGRPRIEDYELPKQGEPLAFAIEIGVRPQAQLGEYKGLEVGRREPVADDAAVEAEIQALRERVGTLETVDRVAQNGDSVVIDYLGRIDGEAFAGGEARDQLLELGSGRFIPGFEEQLVGAQAGDERQVRVTFPDGYPGDMGGKEATFDVAVKEVKAKQLPELDEDFAVEAGGFDTVEELREDIRTRLRESEQAAIEREFEEAVLEAAVREATIDVPSELVHERAHELLEETMSALTARGISKEMYLRITGKDEEALAHEAEPQAEQALRREAVLAAVVEAEKIQPTDEELIQALAPVGEREGEAPEELLARVRENGRLEQLRADIASRLAVELLVREAKPISVEQAQARDKLWTPGGAEAAGGSTGQLWTPGS